MEAILNEPDPPMDKESDSTESSNKSEKSESQTSSESDHTEEDESQVQEEDPVSESPEETPQRGESDDMEVDEEENRILGIDNPSSPAHESEVTLLMQRGEETSANTSTRVAKAWLS